MGVFPSKIYSFVPQNLVLSPEDCVHVQWTGSDYNPNRFPNNGFGGPRKPIDDVGQNTDRLNIMHIASKNDNIPFLSSENFTLFDSVDKDALFLELALLNQENSENITSLMSIEGTVNDRESS